MKLRLLFLSMAIVSVTLALADVLNVVDHNRHAPREEPSTIVPTRPPGDPETEDMIYSVFTNRRVLGNFSPCFRHDEGVG